MPIYSQSSSSSGGITQQDLDAAIDALPPAGDGFTTIYETHTGATATNLFEPATLTFDVTGKKEVHIYMLFQPYNDNWGGGTDIPVLRMNLGADGHNTAVKTNFGGDGTYTNTNHIKLSNASSNSIMAINATIKLDGVFNTVSGEANLGVVGGSLRSILVAGQWLPATPVAVTSIRITTAFGDTIGMGSNSHIVIRAK